MLLMVLAQTSACSPLRIAEGLFLGQHFDRRAGLRYGSEVRQLLDVYRTHPMDTPAPVVIFLYGGRWQNGSKDQYRILGDAFTRRGIVVVVPDYRLYPEAGFPAWVHDAARVVNWTRRNISRFGGDSTRLWVVGHSAGGHTAALLALDEHYLLDAGVPAGAVHGFVSLAGPVMTSWTDADVQALMGPSEGWSATYPVTHIDGREAPILLLHGGNDKTVWSRNSTELAARITARGGCAKAIVYPGLGHVEIVVALAAPQLGIAPVFADVMKFIRDRREWSQKSSERQICSVRQGNGCCQHGLSTR